MPPTKSRATAKHAATQGSRNSKRTAKTIAGKLPLDKAVVRLGYAVVQDASTPVLVKAIRQGVHADFLKQMATDMDVSLEHIYGILGLPRATIIRKAKKNKRMSPDESERALGLARLIGQAEEMVARSGNPEGFDAAQWMAQWLQEPNAALGGKRPADWMDTAPGRELVSQTLARLESGAYA